MLFKSLLLLLGRKVNATVTNATPAINIAGPVMNESDSDGDPIFFVGLGTGTGYGWTLTLTATQILVPENSLAGNFTGTGSDNTGVSVTGTLNLGNASPAVFYGLSLQSPIR